MSEVSPVSGREPALGRAQPAIISGSEPELSGLRQQLKAVGRERDERMELPLGLRVKLYFERIFDPALREVYFPNDDFNGQAFLNDFGGDELSRLVRELLDFPGTEFENVSFSGRRRQIRRIGRQYLGERATEIQQTDHVLTILNWRVSGRRDDILGLSVRREGEAQGVGFSRTGVGEIYLGTHTHMGNSGLVMLLGQGGQHWLSHFECSGGEWSVAAQERRILGAYE